MKYFIDKHFEKAYDLELEGNFKESAKFFEENLNHIR